MTSIAYLGPQSSFSHQAAQLFNPKAKMIDGQDFNVVFDAVLGAHTELGIIPIDNMIEGMVSINLDLMYEKNVAIVSELVMPVHLALASPGKSTDRIELVVSHAHALAQCRHYLQEHMPNAAQKTVESTSLAMAYVRDQGPHAAAIGSLVGAEHFGLEVLDYPIEDARLNRTRFWIISRRQAIAPKAQKTSVAVYVDHDRPGWLYDALGIFAKRGINLLSLISRPSSLRLGNYIFFMDLQGSLNDPLITEAITELGLFADSLKVLGSYAVELKGK